MNAYIAENKENATTMHILLHKPNRSCGQINMSCLKAARRDAQSKMAEAQEEEEKGKKAEEEIV